MTSIFRHLSILSVFILAGCTPSPKFDHTDFEQSFANAGHANEGYNRCMHYVRGWLAERDSLSGLIPQNLTSGRDVWNGHNSAADNYPFMVLTTYLLDKEMYHTVMRDMLAQERALTSRVGPLPDEYSFSRQAFSHDKVDMSRIVFSTSEYIKDGLVPLMEYLGPSPWLDRMMEMLDALSEHMTVIKPGLFGIESDRVVEEVNGEMLQTLSRVYWMTGNEKYLDWAERIADYYLLGERDLLSLPSLRIRDHGCEIIGGLSEVYVAMHYSRPEKKKLYRDSYYRILDRVLEIGRNADGMFYDAVDPRTGEVLRDRISDTWGYVYDAYYTVYLIDGKEPYREAVLKAMRVVNSKYRSHDWEGNADGYADAIESGINLYNREEVQSLAEWLDSEIRVMWQFQQPSGIIEGWHGDGNFARTTIMYCLWKTKGAHCTPWRSDLQLGATSEGDTLRLVLTTNEPWSGTLRLDGQRHRAILNLPVDYPRINQFPEWFTPEDDRSYVLATSKEASHVYAGRTLKDGIPMSLDALDTMYALVFPAN
jgi:hypothetical protein